MEHLEIELLAILVIIAFGQAGGLAPGKLRGKARFQGLLGPGSVAAGGVFLGAGLIHLLPDSVAGLRRASPQLDFPLPFLLAGAGFLSIFAIKTLVTTGVADPRWNSIGSRPWQ